MVRSNARRSGATAAFARATSWARAGRVARDHGFDRAAQRHLSHNRAVEQLGGERKRMTTMNERAHVGCPVIGDRTDIQPGARHFTVRVE